MVNLKSPGAYWESALFKSKAPAVIGEGANAIMGITQKGELDTPIEVTSWDDFVKKCGTFFTPVGVNDLPLAFPVFEYFRNRGSRLIINRVTRHVMNVSTAVKSTVTLVDGASTPQNTLQIDAKSEGTWGDNLAITINHNPKCDTVLASGVSGGVTALTLVTTYGLSIGSAIKITEGLNVEYKVISAINAVTNVVTLASAITNAYTVAATIKSCEFDLLVYESNVLVEQFVQNSMVETDERYVETISSSYITVTNLGSGSAPGLDIPVEVTLEALTGGNDGLSGLTDSDYVGNTTGKYGFYAFSKRPTADLRLSISVPSRTSSTIVNSGVSYCSSRGDCYFVADIPSTDVTATDMIAFKVNESAVDSTYACFLAGWNNVRDQNSSVSTAKKAIPPSIYKLLEIEKRDASLGPWRVAAGTDNIIEGIIDQVVEISKELNDSLNDANIQVIKYVSGYGFVVWGGRTASSQLRYRYENTIRTIQYIGDKLTKQAVANVFDSNDDTLAALLISYATELLSTLYSKRAFKGDTQQQAYFVICDDTNNSEADIDAGKRYCDIGIAMNKPAEFIVFRVGVWEGGSSVITL